MTVREIFYSLSKGEVQTIESIDKLEIFIKDMFKGINPMLLEEEMTTSKNMCNRDIENWEFTFTPMVQLNLDDISCCNISVGFRFGATLKEEHALQKSSCFDTKNTIFCDNFLVIMSTNVLNLENFFKKYDKQIFYVDPITGEREIRSDAFFKGQAHTKSRMDDHVFLKREAHLDFYRTKPNNLTILFDV